MAVQKIKKSISTAACNSTNYIYDAVKSTLTISNNKNSPGLVVPLGGGSSGVSSLNQCTGDVSLIGDQSISVSTSENVIKLGLRAINNPSFYWQYDLTMFSPDSTGAFDVSMLNENDVYQIKQEAIAASQNGNGVLLGFNYNNEGSIYGVSVSSDFNSSGFWVEWLTKNPADNSLWLVRIDYTATATTGTSHKVTTSGQDAELRNIPVITQNGSTVKLGDYITSGNKLIDQLEVNQVQSTLMSAINGKCDYKHSTNSSGIINVIAPGVSISDFQAELFANNRVKIRITFYLESGYDPYADPSINGIFQVNLTNNTYYIDNYIPLGRIQSSPEGQTKPGDGYTGETFDLINISTSSGGGYTLSDNDQEVFIYLNDDGNFYMQLKTTESLTALGEDNYYVEFEIYPRKNI